MYRLRKDRLGGAPASVSTSIARSHLQKVGCQQSIVTPCFFFGNFTPTPLSFSRFVCMHLLFCHVYLCMRLSPIAFLMYDCFVLNSGIGLEGGVGVHEFVAVRAACAVSAWLSWPRYVLCLLPYRYGLLGTCGFGTPDKAVPNDCVLQPVLLLRSCCS